MRYTKPEICSSTRATNAIQTISSPKGTTAVDSHNLNEMSQNPAYEADE
jgi:hypothetical protein